MTADIDDTRGGALAALERAAAHARAYLRTLDERSVASTVSSDTLRARLGGPLPERGSDAVEVIDRLVAATDGGHLGNAGGRFFAWVIGGSTNAALAADWLTSAWDQNPALHSVSPSAAMAEEVVGPWLLELLDLPREASFAFTTGCQMAHVTCLAAARDALLARRGWDVNERGLCGAPGIEVLVSAEQHASVARALRLLGIGASSLRALPVRADGAVDPQRFASIVGQVHGPCLVCLSAADLNIAAIDPFAELIPLAHAHGAWVHVDGAFGLIARASPRLRPLLEGVELADSWATDAHKWLNVPYDCGIAFVRDREAHRRSMATNASYVTNRSDVREPMDFNPEWSRRARGFPLWAMLQELGREGVARIVERCCEHARAIVTGIGALPGAEMLWEPTLNQGLLRFLDPAGVDHDARTSEVMARINASGEAFFSGTTWRGMRAVRVSVCNARTTAQDVQRTIEAARAALA